MARGISQLGFRTVPLTHRVERLPAAVHDAGPRAFQFGEALGEVCCFLEQRLEFSVGNLAVSRDWSYIYDTYIYIYIYTYIYIYIHLQLGFALGEVRRFLEQRLEFSVGNLN